MHLDEAALVDAAVVARYFDVASTFLVFYDWITILADEINLVWMAPSRPVPRCIFMILRYTTLAAQPVVLLYDFFQPRDMVETCPLYVRVNIGLTYVILACSELIIMLRLLSAYRANPCVYRSLWGAYTGAMLASAVLVGVWTRSLQFVKILPKPQGGALLPGCWTVVGGRQMFGVLGILIVWELGIAAMSFWSTWTLYVNTGTPFWDLFFQSGNHFYLWILGISWVNIGLVGLTVRVGLELAVLDRIVLSLTRTAHSVCVAHLLLHIRRQSRSARALEEELVGEQIQSFPLSVKGIEEGGNLTELASIHGGNADGNGRRPGSRVRSRWEERKKRRKDSEALEFREPEGEQAEYDFDHAYPRFASTSESNLTLTPTRGAEQDSYRALVPDEMKEHVEMGGKTDEEPTKEQSSRSHDGLLDSGSIRTLRITETEDRPKIWKPYRRISKSPQR